MTTGRLNAKYVSFRYVGVHGDSVGWYPEYFLNTDRVKKSQLVGPTGKGEWRPNDGR